MIRLLLFAACEKAIVAQDNTSSLISIMESFNLSLQGGEEIPSNASVPLKWHIFALWARNGDIPEPIEFEESFELISPNGESYLRVEAKFVASNEHLNFRTAVELPTFPIGLDGIYRLLLSYKRTDSENWEQVGEYPIRVIHQIGELKNATEVENKVENEQSIKSV